jgi:hypothetical protein
VKRSKAFPSKTNSGEQLGVSIQNDSIDMILQIYSRGLMRAKTSFGPILRTFYAVFLGSAAAMMLVSLITSARTYSVLGGLSNSTAATLGHSGTVWFGTAFGLMLVPAFIMVEVLARSRARKWVSRTVGITCVGAVFVCFLLRLSFDWIFTLLAAVVFLLTEFLAVMIFRENRDARRIAGFQFTCYFGFFWYFIHRDFSLFGLVPIFGFISTMLWVGQLPDLQRQATVTSEV